MNIFKSSFLIIGEGITFQHCSSFFEENDIIYFSTTTSDVVDINDNRIICKKKKIDLDKVLWALEDLQHHIIVPEEIASKARGSIERMLELS